MLQEFALRSPDDVGAKGTVEFLRSLVAPPPGGELRPVGGGEHRGSWADEPGLGVSQGLDGGSVELHLDSSSFSLERRDSLAGYRRSTLSPRLRESIPVWWKEDWLVATRRIRVRSTVVAHGT